MAAINTLSQKYNFKIIEDASHAIGALYDDIKVGSKILHSDITVFSFHPVKIITTGEGGMATTNEVSLANRMRNLRSHGVVKEKGVDALAGGKGDLELSANGTWFNYRMTDIQAALGLGQMKRLDRFVYRRHEIAKSYNDALRTLPISIPWQAPGSYSSYPLSNKGGRPRLQQKPAEGIRYSLAK